MSEVKFVPESDSLSLNQEGSCQLKVENGGKTVVYKIKSNLGDKVQVNHVYGIIGGGVQPLKGTIMIKYMGVRDSMEDVKVRICWVEADSLPQSHNPSHEQLSRLYSSSRQKSEQKVKDIVLKVIMESPKRSSFIDKLNIAQSHELRYSRKISNHQSKAIEEVRESLSRLKKAKEEMVQLQQEEQQRLMTEQRDLSLSLRLTIALILLAFMLGISFGIRIEINQHPEALSSTSL